MNELIDVRLPAIFKTGNTLTLYTITGLWCKSITIDEEKGFYSMSTYHLVKYSKKDTKDKKEEKYNNYIQRVLDQGQLCQIVSTDDFYIDLDIVNKRNEQYDGESTEEINIEETKDANIEEFLKKPIKEKNVWYNPK
jgi:hypothetical protein